MMAFVSASAPPTSSGAASKEKSPRKQASKEHMKAADVQRKLLKEIKSKNGKVRDILKKCPADEVEEFVATSLSVESVMSNLLQDGAGTQPVDQHALQTLLEAVKQFHQYTRSLDDAGKLKRYTQSSHLRPKLQTLNSAVDGELRVFILGDKEECTPPPARSKSPPNGVKELAMANNNHNGSNGGGPSASLVTASAPASLQTTTGGVAQPVAAIGRTAAPAAGMAPRLNADMKKLTASAYGRLRSFSRVADDEGQGMWTHEFGPDQDQVAWATFIRGFTSAMRALAVTVTDEDENFLHMALDHANTGHVSNYRFSEFLKGFGPLKRCVPYMRRILSEKWFYGFLSGDESLRLLMGQPTGTFLVRFSRSKPGSFALGFVWGDGKVLSVLITGNMPQGLIVREQGEIERTFDNLYSVLEFYKQWLLIPFSGSLSKESWFHGDLTKEEAEDLLKDQKPGTFLIRFGESHTSYYCSYVAPSGAVVHAEIQSDNAGVMPQEQKGTIFATLNEYVRANRHVLRYNYDPEGVPLLRVRPLDGKLLEHFSGPNDPNRPGEAHNRYGSAKSVSTYPASVGGYNLICDRFGLQVLSNWSIMCVADGCSWGVRACEAALRASSGFMEYMRDQYSRMPDLKEVGHCLLRGFSIAHNKIVEGKPEILEAGTTTLLGGVVLELIDADKQGDFKYAFICASVGDSKAFLWSPKHKQALDITARNRGGMDARDPGGRLGPYLEGGAPDTRNLKVFFELCREGDIVLCMTDGVHDNFDPKCLGFEPADFDLNGTWDDVPTDVAERVKQRFQQQKMQEVLANVSTPREAVETLLNYCVRLTKAQREFMDANPKAKQPADFKKYPGKMDHTTCVALQVGIKTTPGAMSTSF